MKRIEILPFALLLAACGAPAADASKPATPKPAEPKIEQQQLANLAVFDVGVFSLAPPAIPARVTNEVLVGVEVAARPLILECLVDPKNRGADKHTKVVIDATLGDAGVTHKISGDNLTPTGTACVDAAMKKWAAAAAGLDAKAALPGAAVTSHIEVEHLVGVSPAVVPGANDASKIAGSVRLGLATWGDCFADWKSAPPRPLRASIKVLRPKPAAPQVTPAEVTFEPANDPVADKVAACLKAKILALSVDAPSGDSLTFPFPFRFLHSGVSDALPGATPEVAFAQLDLQRARRAAEAAIAVGGRTAAGVAYDDAVKRYKANDKKQPVSVKDLKDGCAALLAADDKVISAIDQQLAVEDTTHAFAVKQKAADPAWADAETAAAKKLDEAKKDEGAFKQQRVSDEGACPKVKP